MPSFTNKMILLFLVTATLTFSLPVRAQITNEIILSLKTGNAKNLSAYFNQNVELVVQENDNVYSKAQAQLIVNDFFSTHPPQNFSVIHQSGKEGAQYVIGNLETKRGSFRVYFLLKNNDGKDYIHQLRIETQE